MQGKSNRHRTPRRAAAQPAVFDLRPERAFVLHLDLDAEPPRRVTGRIEHVISGRVAHVVSLRALLCFLADVLRAPARDPSDAARPPIKRR